MDTKTFINSLPFEVENNRNQTIRGTLFLPESNSFKDLVVLANPSQTNQDALVPWAEYFCSCGIATLTFDFCGGTFDSISDGNYYDMSVVTEAEDLCAVLNWAFQLFPVAEIWLVGISQGGMAAALAAVSMPEISGLILFMPAFIIPDYGREFYKDKEHIPDHPQVQGEPVGRKYYLDTIEMDIFDEIRPFKSPVLIIHGEKDPEVPVWYAKKAAEVYSQANLIVFPEEGHIFSENSWLKSMEETVRFIEEHSKSIPLQIERLF